MANTFKLSSKAGVTSVTVIYTAASQKTAIILGLVLGNTTSSQVTCTVTWTVTCSVTKYHKRNKRERFVNWYTTSKRSNKVH